MERVKPAEEVLAYNGQIVTFQLSQHKGSAKVGEKTILAFSRKTFQSGTFTETSSGQHAIPSGESAVAFACSKSVTDLRTGIKLPCVLLKTREKKSRGSSRLILLQVHHSNEVEQRLKFKVGTETPEDLRLIDGPTVLWRKDEKLFYISSLTSGIVMAPVSVSAVYWAGALEDGTYIFCSTNGILEGGCLPGPSPCDRTFHGREFVLYNTENQKKVSGSCLVPHAYASVLQHLHVCSACYVNGTYKTSLIGATHKQLIWFQDGIPMRVCQLPYEGLSMLQVAYASRADMLCVLSFASGDVCAIWRDGWKTADTWQHVGRTLVDDFVGRGSDQLLLLFKDDPENPPGQPAFRLTDCAEISYPVDCRDDKITDNQYQENHLLMVQTLEARLQASLGSLEEMENHLHVQERVLQSSCEALLRMCRGQETPVCSAEEEHLVPLWDDTDNGLPNPSSEVPSSSSVDPEHIVEKVWHRVVDDSLVFGVKLKDSAFLSLTDFGLSLIMDQEIAFLSPVTKCQTNVLKLAISVSPDSGTVRHREPTAKRQRLDDNSKDTFTGNCWQRPCPPPYQNDLEHTVTAVTELSSVLALSNAACALLLHARRKNQPDGLLRSEKLIVPCGRIPLSLEDVLKGKRTINVFEHCQDVGQGSLEDIFALLSAFQKCWLHIVSPDCTLTSLRAWLQDAMQAEPLSLMSEVMMCGKPGSLRGTLFMWDVKTPCEGNLTIFYRNNGVILQCLHSLRSILPPTCVVKVMRAGSGGASLTRDLLRSLEEELLALRNVAAAAAAEVESELTPRCKTDNNITHTTKPSSDRSEQVQKYREDLEMEQRQIRLGDHLSTSSELYRRSLLSVAQIQFSSDALACRLAKELSVQD
ncbi:Fanconi anemia group B protein isoform X2 [Hyperolius riggenbachi]|uniref:Fanconi anemia group B protein isoform X2 n=1 Tax=Hyperolius riggenbachi TaxID=752182 RepID=UPI0035A273BB